jgi:rod shape-determining protein MreC
MKTFNSPLKNKVGLLLAILVIISILLIVTSSDSTNFSFKTVGFNLFSLIQEGITNTVKFIKNTITSIRELRELKIEYEKLLNELSTYKEMERAVNELTIENNQLRKNLQITSDLIFKNIPSTVIGKDPENYNSAIVINKGSKDNIKKNQAVIAVQEGKTGLVGKVISVSKGTSLIKPISDVSTFVAARLNKSRYEGLVNGLGVNNDLLIMRYLKKYSKNDIEYGDMVITSGMRSLYPRGIQIGTVTAVNAKTYETSLELTLKPVIEFAKLEYVYVLSGTQ